MHPTCRAALVLILALLAPFASAALDPARIDALTGLKGTWNEAEQVYKVTQPRNDLNVVVMDGPQGATWRVKG